MKPTAHTAAMIADTNVAKTPMMRTPRFSNDPTIELLHRSRHEPPPATHVRRRQRERRYCLWRKRKTRLRRDGRRRPVGETKCDRRESDDVARGKIQTRRRGHGRRASHAANVDCEEAAEV